MDFRRCSAARAVFLVVGLAFSSAHAADDSRPDKPAKQIGGQVEKSGGILVVRGVRGGEPQITDEQGKRFLLTGKWRLELLRLGGHRVKVVGQLGEKKLFQPTVKVDRYEIVDSGGGKKPHVGRLVVQSKGLVLKGAGRELPIQASAALLSRLKKRAGCKVWIVGDVVANALKAKKYGWLSCKKEAPIKAPKETPR